LTGQATTGLTVERFDELVDRVGQRVVWDSGRGRPRVLALRQAVKVVVMYLRTNVTEELIAELLFVDQSTISRVISDLKEIIAEALEEFVPELPEELQGRVAVVDGSLCPCWSWADSPELHSGKHKTTGHVHQFVCDLSGNLLHISDPLPGKTHDAKAMDDTGLSDLLGDENSFGDKGYSTSTPALPSRIANLPVENSSTGRKNSIPRSTRFGMLSNGRSLISRPGAGCTPTTADRNEPMPRLSRLSGYSISSN
jgi:hypothetical protein